MPRHLWMVSGLLISLLWGVHANAEIYKTVDKNGRTTYTDVPPANTLAKPVELKTVNSIPAPTAIPPDNHSNNTQAAVEYQIQILAPENGATLMANERSITASVAVTPALSHGDLLAYKLDGAVLTTSREMSYLIVEPPRGEHLLTVDVVNSEGHSVAQSNAVTVVVIRPIIKQQATPALKK